MKGLRKRPLKDHNIVEIPKVQRRLQNNCEPECSENSKPPPPLSEEMLPKTRNTRKRCIKKSNSEGPSTPNQKKIDNYFFKSPRLTSPNENLNDVTKEREGRNKSIKLNTEEVIMKANKLFLEDIRQPRLTPFSVVNFSCSSSTCCAEENHKKQTEQLSQDDEQVLMSLINENCWYILLPPLNCHLTENIYLSPLILRSLFYAITVENDETTCLSLVDVLKRHLKLHPPCRKDMNKIYHEVLFGKIKIGEFVNPDIVKYNFDNIVKTIEETCQQKVELETEEFESRTAKKEEEIGYATKSTTIEDLISHISINYIHNKNILALPEFNYEDSDYRIPKVDLLKRLFIVFNIILDILEEDFRMWWMKSRYKLREKLNGQSGPLVAEVAWKKKEEKGSINEHCVLVFMLFKNCPVIYRHHLSRYISMLFEIARVNEINEKKRFPFFSTLCCNFAEELSSHIKGNNEINDETVNLVQYIYPDWLRFKVVGLILKSNVTSEGIDDLPSIYRIIQRNLKNESNISYESNISERSIKRNGKTNLRLPILKGNPNLGGETELHKYCRLNNHQALKKYLQYPETNVNVTDNFGWTPLHNAAMYNSIDCVKLLIKYRLPPIRGAERLNINSLNDENVSALMCAVENGNLEIVDILLKNGGGPTVRNRNSKGYSALDLARSEQLKNMLQKSWIDCINSFEHISMSPIEIDMLHIMLTSYCSVYHIREPCSISDTESCKRDSTFYFNYAQFYKDEMTFDRLHLLISKLCKIPSNPKNLHKILLYLKSCNS